QAHVDALIRFKLKAVDAVEDNLPGGDVVIGVAHEHVGQRALAGAVRPHARVDLALTDGQVDTRENGLTLNIRVWVTDFKGCSHAKLWPPIVPLKGLGQCNTIYVPSVRARQDYSRRGDFCQCY